MRLTTSVLAFMALFWSTFCVAIAIITTPRHNVGKCEYELNLISQDICELKDNYTGMTYEVHPDSIPSFLNKLNQ